MFNVVDKLRDKTIETVEEKGEINKQEAFDIIATHILLCTKEWKSSAIFNDGSYIEF